METGMSAQECTNKPLLLLLPNIRLLLAVELQIPHTVLV